MKMSVLMIVINRFSDVLNNFFNTHFHKNVKLFIFDI